MTVRKSLLAALGTVAVVGMWTPQASQAAVAIAIPRPVISIPRVTISAMKPAIPAVTHAVSAPKPVTPSAHTTIALATHAPASVSSTHVPVTARDPNSVPWADVGGTMTLDPNVAVPPHTGPAIAAVLNGKPVIKLTNVNGNETTVYYLSRDQKHIVAAISSISAVPPESVATTPPVNQPAAQRNQPSSVVTSTPVSYPEIRDAQGRPMGYINAQGQNIYFPNGQIPPGFTVGPNNTIQTTISSTSTTNPPSRPVPAPQPPASSQPAPSPGKVTNTPVSYPEITDANGAPMGYINAQGLAVYFTNGQMPPGFSVGPNHTIQAYVRS